MENRDWVENIYFFLIYIELQFHDIWYNYLIPKKSPYKYTLQLRFLLLSMCDLLILTNSSILRVFSYIWFNVNFTPYHSGVGPKPSRPEFNCFRYQYHYLVPPEPLHHFTL